MGSYSLFESQLYPILYLNLQSIKNKKDLLETLIATYKKLPILCFCETWLRQDEVNAYFPFFNKYNIFRIDRQKGYGGVAILCPRSMKVAQINATLNNNYEAVWVRIFFNEKKIDLVNIYQPPRPNSKDMPKALTDYIDKYFKPNNTTIIMGDFNYSGVDWMRMTATKQNGQDLFVDHTCMLGLTQKVNFATRGKNVLDLVFTNEPDVISNIETTQKLSDHESLTFNLITQKTILKQKNFYDFKNGDYERLNTLISGVNWHELFEQESVENAYEIFEGKLRDFINICIPKIFLRSKTNFLVSNKQQQLCDNTNMLYKKIQKKS